VTKARRKQARPSKRNTELGETRNRWLPEMGNKSCDRCGIPFDAKRSDAKFCSARCRVSAHRRKREQQRWEQWDKRDRSNDVAPESCCWRGDCACVRAKRNEVEVVTVICPPIRGAA
jgi:hypothetical protein